MEAEMLGVEELVIEIQADCFGPCQVCGDKERIRLTVVGRLNGEVIARVCVCDQHESAGEEKVRSVAAKQSGRQLVSK